MQAGRGLHMGRQHLRAHRLGQSPLSQLKPKAEETASNMISRNFVLVPCNIHWTERCRSARKGSYSASDAMDFFMSSAFSGSRHVSAPRSFGRLHHGVKVLKIWLSHSPSMFAGIFCHGKIIL